MWSTLSLTIELILSSKVQQNPSDLIQPEGDTVELKCLHIVKNYNIILWYKNSANHTFELMGYLWNKKDYVEPNFTEKIGMKGDANKNSSLIIKNLSSADSTEYFCAASFHSDTYDFTSAQKLSL